jgi:sugar phosphate isomerase/epimerase
MGDQLGHESRREFLAHLAGVLAAPAVAGLPDPPSRTHRGVDQLGAIGIQTYTVRNLMAKDPNGTLAALAQIGYTEVELTKRDGANPPGMRKMLDQNHLAAVSGHLELADMRQNWPQALDDAAARGQRYIVCSWVAEADRTPDGWKRVVADLNSMGETARQHGIQLAYHNHMYEWTPAGSIIPYDYLLAECDPHLVQMEIDIMWMTKAGHDPLQYFAKYPLRFPMLHVKDMTKQGEMVDVGRGSIDFAAIFARARQGGVKHYFVEHDSPPDPIADARVCYDFLR